LGKVPDIGRIVMYVPVLFSQQRQNVYECALAAMYLFVLPDGMRNN
jgi:hypothetical protein